MPPNQSELSLDLKLDPSWDWSRVDDTILENLISLFCTSSVLYVNYEKGLVLYCPLIPIICWFLLSLSYSIEVDFYYLLIPIICWFLLSVDFYYLFISIISVLLDRRWFLLSVDFYYLLIPIICWFLLSVDFYYLCLTR